MAAAAPSSEDLALHILHLLDASTTGELATTEGLTYPNDSTIDPVALHGALSSLDRREMIVYTPMDADKWVLTAEGADIARDGSHEAKVFAAVPAGKGATISIADLTVFTSMPVGPDVAKIGQGKAFKNKWIGKAADGSLQRLVASIMDVTQRDLVSIRDTGAFADAKVLAELKKRKLCDKVKVTHYKVTKGEKFGTEVVKQATDLTVDMLLSGAWKTLDFKKFNFDALGREPAGGHLHPLMKVREEFRQVFFEMGFEEMPTNRYVESSFWNFDALFQPQQHPARDMHDTFFLSSPATGPKYPRDVMERVKQVHTSGGYGSIGYGYEWKEEEAEKLLLRTHTTAVSSHMLYKLATQPGGFKPAKYFSIDRVFRNETVDATHLAEFHQVEGVIADRNLTLGDLIGIINVFCAKMGVTNVRFKPAYNPYTEPSLEIFSYHAGLGKWIELGNSGMFRPEMLRPLGLPEDVRVIAWGLSLERPTMIKYEIDNIRELLGHKCDLEMIQSNPICRLDKKMGREN
ncbi:tRNA synthetases class II core domain (F)-domain-containing protein [Blastocladiella britannica]|nr:tRNA synthetases class II core domain (F)-domain-containing protein [Blastocladiella britannica]